MSMTPSWQPGSSNLPDLIEIARAEGLSDAEAARQKAEIDEAIASLRTDLELRQRIAWAEEQARVWEAQDASVSRFQRETLQRMGIKAGPASFGRSRGTGGTSQSQSASAPSGGSNGQLPGFDQWNRFQKAGFWMGMSVSPIMAATLAAVIKGCTSELVIGFGATVMAGAGAGVSAGGGVCFDIHNGLIGGYGSITGVAGAVYELFAGLQWTLIHGDKSSFTGTAYMVGVDGGELLGGGVGVYFSLDRMKFLGASMSFGFCGGSPVNAYTGIGHTFG